MTQIANIADNMTDSQKCAWNLLISELSKYNDQYQFKADSYSVAAALMCLVKRNALAFKFDSDPSDSSVFFRVHTNVISEQVAEELGVGGIDSHKTLDFCTSIPESDPLYKTVNDSLSRLSYGNVPKGAIEFLADLISGKRDISESCGFFDGVIQNSGHVALYLDAPVELYELISRIVNFNGKKVLNLFQNGFIPFAKTISGYKSFRGIGINPALCDFTSLYLSLCDKELPVEYVSPEDLAAGEVGRYDSVISSPQVYKINSNGESIDFRTFAMEKFDSMINDNGGLVTFAPANVIFDQSDDTQDLREYVLDNDFLDTIILLPQRLLYGTSIPLVMLILRKGREMEEDVLMVDASKMSIKSSSTIVDRLDVDAVFDAFIHEGENSRYVSCDAIEENDYSYDVQEYFYSHVQTTDPEFREGFDGLCLCDILDEVPTETSYDDREGKIVYAKDIPWDWTDNKINIDKLVFTDDLSECGKLSRPALLVNAAGGKMKIAWCEATEEHPVFLGPNVHAGVLKNENISIDYLAMEIGKKKRVYDPDFAYCFPWLSFGSLGSVWIDFPSLNNSDSIARQIALFNEGKAAYLMGKATGLQETIDRLKEEYIKNVRMRRHDMKPYLRQIRSSNELLLQFSDELSPDVMSILTSQKTAIDALSASLDRLTLEDKFGEPDPIDVADYLRRFVEKHIADVSCSVELSIDEAAIDECKKYGEDGTLRINIAREDLEDLVHNIVTNAEVHGFIDPGRRDYLLRIVLSVDNERDMAVIEFWNNGIPFPKGMTKDRYSLLSEKAGKTAGTGVGGYRVKNIVEHYDGDFEISDPEASPVFVRIYLPIYRE